MSDDVIQASLLWLKARREKLSSQFHTEEIKKQIGELDAVILRQERHISKIERIEFESDGDVTNN